MSEHRLQPNPFDSKKNRPPAKTNSTRRSLRPQDQLPGNKVHLADQPKTRMNAERRRKDTQRKTIEKNHSQRKSTRIRKLKRRKSRKAAAKSASSLGSLDGLAAGSSSTTSVLGKRRKKGVRLEELKKLKEKPRSTCAFCGLTLMTKNLKRHHMGCQERA